jgi:hypothetical protein
MKGRFNTAIGFRAVKGGAVAVAVSLQHGPRVLLSSFLATAEDGDRLSLEPYQVAYEMKRGTDGTASAEATAAVADGRQRQCALATVGLEKIVTQLKALGCESLSAALLLNRATWITDVLSYSLASSDHPPVAEGLAVREAIRLAVNRANIELDELDEKSLLERASMELSVPEVEIFSTLLTLGVGLKPWRREQKNACLAAWLLLATFR